MSVAAVVLVVPGVTRESLTPVMVMLENASRLRRCNAAAVEFIRSHRMLGDILKTPINLGFIFAILLAVLVWYVLNKTTLGYELRAVGINPHAAEAGGINVKKSMVISMLFAGGVAGAAGAFQVLGVSHRIAKLAAMEGYGFDGIAVSLIGNNTGLGCVLAGIFFGALKYGGSKIQHAIVGSDRAARAGSPWQRHHANDAALTIMGTFFQGTSTVHVFCFTRERIGSILCHLFYPMGNIVMPVEDPVLFSWRFCALSGGASTPINVNFIFTRTLSYCI